MIIKSYFPKTVVSNDDILKDNDGVNIERLEKKLGIKSRFIASKEETSLDLAYKACEKFTSTELKGIDFILFCTQSPEYFLPTTACILQNKLELPKSCGALDFNLGCSGYVYGLGMAKSLLIGNVASKVLLVTAETYSKYLSPYDWSNRAILGDAATATILDKEDLGTLGEFDLGSDGGGANNLIVKNGAANSGFDKSNSKYDYLFMNGPDVFKFTLDNVPLTIKACLEKNSKSIEEVDYVIFHQANKYMLKKLRKKVGIAEDKFYINITNIGNTVSNTIPLALKDSLERGLIKSGDCVLLCGFGVGYSWGSTILHF